jgi:tetratricopeptide (TPR) repeat protein
MATKKRRFEQLQAAAAAPREKATYVDPFQQQVVPRLEEVGKKFEGKGRTIMYMIGGLILVVIIAMLLMSWSRRSGAAAQTALGKAIETSQAQISETGPLAGSTQKTFKTEKERSEAAIGEFQAVADKFGGSVAEKAKYFIAVNRIFVDRGAAVQELEEISKNSNETGKLAKFALAQTRVEDNRLDDAAALYKELIGMSDPVVSKDTLNFELAKVYEKQGKKQEALDLYFSLAKTAAEAKDMDGKAVPMTQTANDAKDKVKELDPEKAKEIPEATPSSPFGS